MFTRGSKPASANSRILVVRLGSMGDVVHALPAVATLKHSFPGCHLSWIVDPKWTVLLEGNPFVDSIIRLERRTLSGIASAWRELRGNRPSFAVDFQGLIKSALTASVARPERIYGFHQSQLREPLAALFYSSRIKTRADHIVDQNLELASASGASSILRAFPIPEGAPEGDLPEEGFVLANPFAGWGAKQWPLEYYDTLARLLKSDLGLTLVLNGPPESEPLLAQAKEPRHHVSGLAGLIHATRRAVAVVGIDSGPLHLAAALGKSGVAVFGPTNPARNGPYGNTFAVLRSSRAVTSYKRRGETDESMREITPEAVLEALKARISGSNKSAGCPA